MIVKIVLVFAGLVAGSTAALSAALRSDTESCLSHSLPDDQQIAACSAAIRSSKQDNRAKGLALLERAGAYGRRGEYGRAIADTTQAISTTESERRTGS